MYSVGAQITSTGPEPEPPVWKIYDAVDRSNGKVGFKSTAWLNAIVPVLVKQKNISESNFLEAKATYLIHSFWARYFPLIV